MTASSHRLNADQPLSRFRSRAVAREMVFVVVVGGLNPTPVYMLCRRLAEMHEGDETAGRPPSKVVLANVRDARDR
jgi:hypothetical protein